MTQHRTPHALPSPPAQPDAGAVADAAAAPVGCTNLKLRQAARLVTRHYEDQLQRTGLKITQYSLLAHVVTLGPLRAGALAARMQLDASTLSRNLQPLVAQGWVQVTAGVDARSRLVEATDAGRLQRKTSQVAWKRAQQALNARLGASRVVALHAMLDGCIAALNNEGADAAHGEGNTHV